MFTPNEELKSFFKKEFIHNNPSDFVRNGSFLKDNYGNNPKGNSMEYREVSKQNQHSSIQDYLPNRGYRNEYEDDAPASGSFPRKW